MAFELAVPGSKTNINSVAILSDQDTWSNTCWQMDGIFWITTTLEKVFTDGIGMAHRHGHVTWAGWRKCHALLQNVISSVVSSTIRALFLCFFKRSSDIPACLLQMEEFMVFKILNIFQTLACLEFISERKSTTNKEALGKESVRRQKERISYCA